MTTAVRPELDLKKITERLEMNLHDALTQVDRVDLRESQGHDLRETDVSVRRSCKAIASDCRDALHRIQMGTFGLCLQCDGRIDEERLRQFPYAPLCIECKKRAPKISEEGASTGNGEGGGPVGTPVVNAVSAPSLGEPPSEASTPAPVATVLPGPPPQEEPAKPVGAEASKQFADIPIPQMNRGGAVDSIAVKDIKPAERNARRGELTGVEGLAASIASIGLQHRLVVRKAKDGDGYELIDGHRRLAAVKHLGWDEVPVDLFEMTDVQQLEAMLATAIQRAGLSPLEEAHGFQRMIEEHQLSQRELADRIGVSQALISKRVALLDLPDAAIELVDSSRITLQGAEELLKLREHPKQLKAAVDRVVQISKPLSRIPSEKTEVTEEAQTEPELEPVEFSDVTRAVDSELRNVVNAEKLAKIRAKVKDEGLQVISYDALHKIHYNKRSEIGSQHHGKLAVPLGEHKKEECHRVQIQTGDSYTPPRAIHLCIDISRHSKKGKSALKVVETSGQRSFTDEDRERQELRKRMEVLAGVAKERQAFAVSLASKKITATDALWAMSLATQLNQWERLPDVPTLCEWLELKLDNNGDDASFHDAADRALAAFIEADKANRAKVVFLAALDIIESVLDTAVRVRDRFVWIDATGYLGFLERHGYTITEPELTEIKRQADDREALIAKANKGKKGAA